MFSTIRLVKSVAAPLMVTSFTARYSDSAWGTVDVCKPTMPVFGQGRPGILLIHGGGWNGGGREGFQSWCMKFAQNDVVAATIDYRLANLSEPESRWPTQLEDSKTAWDWFRGKASDYGMDPNRICVLGGSAGGHIALWLGMTAQELTCVVSIAGPTDLTTLAQQPFEVNFQGLFGANYTSQQLHDASPLYGPIENLPATMIIYGEYDKLVPIEQATPLVTAMRSLHRAPLTIGHPGDHLEGFSGQMFTYALKFIRDAPLLPLHAPASEPPRLQSPETPTSRAVQNVSRPCENSNAKLAEPVFTRFFAGFGAKREFSHGLPVQN